jgi:dihydroorotase-like cyclic amidohydrolase
VTVLPMAALTKGREGREMTEIGFLMDAGAVAFTDCDHVVRNTKVFQRALTYARGLGALVIAHPQEPGPVAPAPRPPRASSPRCAACPRSRPWPSGWGSTATSRWWR